MTSSDGIVTAEAAVSHVVPLCKSRSVGRAKYECGMVVKRRKCNVGNIYWTVDDVQSPIRARATHLSPSASCIILTKPPCQVRQVAPTVIESPTAATTIYIIFKRREEGAKERERERREV